MEARSGISRKVLVIMLCGLGLFSATGCSAFRSYPHYVRRAQSAFAEGNYEKAIRLTEGQRFYNNERLCKLLELGTFHHAAGNYAESNKHFLQAVRVMNEFDERATISMRDSAALAVALLINDKVRPYRGAVFERILVHTYLAENFLLQHDLENARVEIRQAYARQKAARRENERRIQATIREAEKRDWDSDAIAQKVRVAYAGQRDILKNAGNVYQNVFTHYLSSIVYEMGGEISDAYIDAKLVHALNPAFQPARAALLRYSRSMGLRDDYDRWRKEFGEEPGSSVPQGHGEILLLYQCGLAPVKEEVKITLPVPVSDHLSLATLAIPKYRRRSNPVGTARMIVNGTAMGSTETLMDVEATSVRYLWDEAPGIALRQLLRVAGRVVGAEKAREEWGDWAFIAALLFGETVEQADLRSWISLPRNLQAMRVSVPAGTHKVAIELVGYRVLGHVTIDELPVEEGGITIVGLRSVGNHGTATYSVYKGRGL